MWCVILSRVDGEGSQDATGGARRLQVSLTGQIILVAAHSERASAEMPCGNLPTSRDSATGWSVTFRTRSGCGCR
jgi:hypothetical protein